jgi:hypothetical protein
MDYDACLRSKVKNAITHVESVAASRNIAKHMGIKTQGRKVDPTRTPTKVDRGLRTRHVNGFSAPVNGKRYSPSR